MDRNKPLAPMSRDPRFLLDFSINIEIFPEFGNPHLAKCRRSMSLLLSHTNVRCW